MCFARGSEGFGEGEGVAVEGAADDDAGQGEGGEGADLVKGADSAGGDDGPAEGLGKGAGALYGWAFEGAVAGDVGEDYGAELHWFELRGQLQGGDFCGFNPAAHGDAAVASVDAGGDAAGEFFAEGGEPGGRFEGLGADDDAVYAGVEVSEDGVALADAAADLDGEAGFADDGGDDVEVFRGAVEGAVEVNDMEVLGAEVAPFSSHGDGVFGEDGFLVGRAAQEADATSVFEVNGGEDEHGLSCGLR